MTDTTIYYVEEIRRLRRKYARLEAAAKDARDQLRTDEPAYKALHQALEQNAEEAA